MTELERLRQALVGARHVLGMVQRNPQVLNRAGYLDEVQRELDLILNPPPIYEDVTVERWECMECGTIEKESFDICACTSALIVKLTGTRRVQVAQNVERSGEARVTGEDFGASGLIKVAMDDPNDAYSLRNKRVFITWED